MSENIGLQVKETHLNHLKQKEDSLVKIFEYVMDPRHIVKPELEGVESPTNPCLHLLFLEPIELSLCLTLHSFLQQRNIPCICIHILTYMIFKFKIPTESNQDL